MVAPRRGAHETAEERRCLGGQNLRRLPDPAPARDHRVPARHRAHQPADHRPVDRAAHRVGQHGQRDRVGDGPGDGPRGRRRHHPPRAADRPPGRDGAQGQAQLRGGHRAALSAPARHLDPGCQELRAAAQHSRHPDRGERGQRHPRRPADQPRHPVAAGARGPAGGRVHDPLRAPPHQPARDPGGGGRAPDVRAPHRALAPGRRRAPDPRPDHAARHPVLPPPPLLVQGPQGAPAGGRRDRRARRLPGAGPRPGRGRGRLPRDRHRPRALRGHGAGDRGGARALPRRPADRRQRRHRRRGPVPGRARRRCGQGRGRPRTRLPDTPRDRRRRPPAPGDPRGVGRGRRAESRSSPTAAWSTTRTSSWP